MRCQSAASSNAAIAVQVTSPIVSRRATSPPVAAAMASSSSPCRRRRHRPRPPRTHPRERFRLQVGVVEPASEVERGARLASRSPPGRPHARRGRARAIPVRRTDLRPGGALPPGPPAGARGLVALGCGVLPREPDRRGRGGRSVAAGSESRIGLFHLEERSVDVLLPPQRAPETQVRLGLLAIGQCGLERGSCRDPVALRQGRVAGGRSTVLRLHPHIVTCLRAAGKAPECGANLRCQRARGRAGRSAARLRRL